MSFNPAENYSEPISQPFTTTTPLNFLQFGEFQLGDITFYLLIIIDSIGVIENVLAFFLFLQLRIRNLLNPTAHLMLGQQVFFDGLSCGLAILVSIDPFKLISLNGVWNIIICQVWKTQFIYFLVYSYSVYNHVIISFERLIAIVFSLHYSQLKNKLWLYLSIFYVILFVYNLPGLARMSYDLEEHICQITQEYNNIVQAIDVYNVSTVFVGFVFPLAFMVTTNWMVVYRLKIESKTMQKFSGTQGASYHGPNKISEANRALVKISVALAISFISTSIFANVFLFLSALDIITIQQFSPIGNLTILSANVNMTMNPILCIFLLPSLRKNIATWFRTQPAENLW